MGGLKLAERGGKNGKKRAVIATARKLAVLLHRLWVSGEVYEPLRNSSQIAMPAAAQRQNILRKEKQTPKRRVPVTASMDWPTSILMMEIEVENQVAAPAETRTPNLHRANKNRS